MCFGLNVTLPTLTACLILYPLKCGSIFVLIWTIMRSLFSLFFFSTVILETFANKSSMFGRLFVHFTSTSDENVYHVFYSSICMLMSETLLLVYCYYLLIGINCHRSSPIPQFLICRFVTWLAEVTNFFVLILMHRVLIGWYLGLLCITVLEIYGFIVVYSYYVELRDEEEEQEPKMENNLQHR